MTDAERDELTKLRRGGQRVETRQRDSAVGISFFWGGARPPITEVVTYIDAHRSNETGGLTWGSRANLRTTAGCPQHLLRRKVPSALEEIAEGP